jgi:flavin reductase (DIM6/NTAB) family NADH-FMN oxidoreductase RutF
MKRSIGATTYLCVHPDLIVGTYDLEGRPNMMAAAWGGICSSEPPSVGISLRPSRYTYQSLLEKREFTISIPSEEHIVEADYVGIESGKKVDKFAVTGLTPIRSDLVDAPYVDEFPVVLECRLSNTLELGVHTLFVGEILDVKVDEAVLTPEGEPDLVKVRPLIYDSVGMGYFGLGEFLDGAFSAGMSLKR